MEIKRIPVNEETGDDIQRMDYELNGYINILKSIFREGTHLYTTDVYYAFRKEYELLNAEYRLTMMSLLELYAETEEEKSASISFNGLTNELILSTNNRCDI